MTFIRFADVEMAFARASSFAMLVMVVQFQMGNGLGTKNTVKGYTIYPDTSGTELEGPPFKYIQSGDVSEYDCSVSTMSGTTGILQNLTHKFL